MERLWRILLLLCVPAWSVAAEPGYLLPKAGLLQIDSAGVEQTWAMAVTGGWRFSDGLSGELELLQTLSPARYETAAAGPGQNGEYELSSLALYAGYRLSLRENFYMKARSGLLFEQVSTDLAGQQRRREDVGLSGGAGLGMFLYQRLTLELEATVLEQDVRYYSLALHYRL